MVHRQLKYCKWVTISYLNAGITDVNESSEKCNQNDQWIQKPALQIRSFGTIILKKVTGGLIDVYKIKLGMEKMDRDLSPFFLEHGSSKENYWKITGKDI